MITVAKHSGFCEGVKRAVETALSVKDENVYILGELIHNPSVISRLNEKGVKKIDSVDEIGSGTVIIRSHGAGKDVYSKIEQKGLKLIDATCAYVRNIQKKAEEYYNKGYQIVIIGDFSHPEVVGINGWCGGSAIIIGEEDQKTDLSGHDKICVLAQTTFSPEKFEKILKNIVADKKTVEVFNTICYTTVMRQKEARLLARENDCVIVIGGKNSSNTQKLKEICLSECENVFSIEYPGELDISDIIKKYKNIAIVAGASTPSELVKEVYSSMEQMVKADVADTVNEQAEGLVAEETAADTGTADVVTAENLGEEVGKKEEQGNKGESVIISMDQALKEMDKREGFKKGQTVEATIVQVDNEGLNISVGAHKNEYFLRKDEIGEDYDKSQYNAGDTLEVVVTGLAPLTLSRKQFLINKKENELIQEYIDGKPFRVKVSGHNKGGLISKFGTFNVFIPASLIRLRFVKPDEFPRYDDKEIRVKIVEVKGKTIIASAKDVILEEREARDKARAAAIKAFFDSIEAGQIVEGKVVRFTDFGAFVNVNGFDCLAHISDLAWTNVKKAEDVLELNNEYEFVILKIDTEKQHVSLGYKQLQKKPWEVAAEKYPAGSVVKGKVVRIASFGAFVEVEPGIDGLVHVSQITHDWIENPSSVLKVGDEVEAKVLDVNPDAQKLTLSIKALLPEPEVIFAKPSSKKKDEPKEKKREKRSKGGDEMREWSGDDVAAATIGDLIKENNTL